MGLVETESDAQLVEVGSDESMETEAFELMEESGETSAADVAPVSKRAAGGSRRASQRQSARLRALEIEQKRSHSGMTFLLLVCILFLALQAGHPLERHAGRDARVARGLDRRVQESGGRPVQRLRRRQLRRVLHFSADRLKPPSGVASVVSMRIEK